MPSPAPDSTLAPEVLRWQDVPQTAVRELLRRYRLAMEELPAEAPIPGSYWGAPEAGIIGATLYLRPDTPLHSVLHTAAHFICMDEARRQRLHTDCGGTDEEESAVCYLQALLAEAVSGYGSDALWRDMDAWGYSFRLGSARDWFKHDAQDARAWLRAQGLIDASGGLTGRLRA